jgi:hypothetical protein
VTKLAQNRKNGGARTSPAQLDMDDAGDLAWFFGEGQTVFRRSTFGALLERQSLFGQSGGFAKVEGEEVFRHYAVPVSQAYPEAPWPEVVDGEIEYSDLALTAQPISESESSNRDEPSGWAMERLGEIGRKLSRLSPLHRAALELLLGEHGDRCAAPADRGGLGLEELGGRVVAVFPITETGHKLLVDSEAETRKRGAKLHLMPIQRMATIVTQAHAGKGKNSGRWERVLRAAREADALIAAACMAWNAICGEEG